MTKTTHHLSLALRSSHRQSSVTQHLQLWHLLNNLLYLARNKFARTIELRRRRRLFPGSRSLRIPARGPVSQHCLMQRLPEQGHRLRPVSLQRPSSRAATRRAAAPGASRLNRAALRVHSWHLEWEWLILHLHLCSLCASHQHLLRPCRYPHQPRPQHRRFDGQRLNCLARAIGARCQTRHRTTWTRRTARQTIQAA